MAISPSIRQTGDPDLDRVQRDYKAAIDSLTAQVTALQAKVDALTGVSPSGVAPGTYVFATSTSFTVNASGFITKVV